jgi:hypothetical protein
MAQVDVKRAVHIAQEYFSELTGRSSGLLLEEVELIEEDGREYWQITLSAPIPDLTPWLREKQIRDYKTIKIDADSGQVKAMKIRQLT